MKKLFRFISRADSYKDGYHYFGAIDLETAKIMAKQFEKANNDMETRPAYQIKFSMRGILEVNITAGYIKKLR